MKLLVGFCFLCFLGLYFLFVPGTVFVVWLFSVGICFIFIVFTVLSLGCWVLLGRLADLTSFGVSFLHCCSLFFSLCFLRIIFAIVTGAFAFAGVVISNRASNRKNAIEQAKRDTRLEDKIQALSNRVDAHNGMLDRITNIEKSIVKIETKLEGK